MSMADYYWDVYGEAYAEFQDELEWYKDHGYWTTKELEHIKICDLDDHHLLNIDALLRRKQLIYEWPEITEEIKKRRLLDPSVPLMERLKMD